MFAWSDGFERTVKMDFFLKVLINNVGDTFDVLWHDMKCIILVKWLTTVIIEVLFHCVHDSTQIISILNSTHGSYGS